VNYSERGHATKHKFKSIFFQHWELIVEEQGDLLANHFEEKMEEK